MWTFLYKFKNARKRKLICISFFNLNFFSLMLALVDSVKAERFEIWLKIVVIFLQTHGC